MGAACGRPDNGGGGGDSSENVEEALSLLLQTLRLQKMQIQGELDALQGRDESRAKERRLYLRSRLGELEGKELLFTQVWDSLRQAAQNQRDAQLLRGLSNVLRDRVGETNVLLGENELVRRLVAERRIEEGAAAEASALLDALPPTPCGGGDPAPEEDEQRETAGRPPLEAIVIGV